MVTVNVKTLLLCIMIIAITVFVIYLAVAVKNLITTIKETNKILQETEVITSIVSEKVETSEEIIDNFLSALKTFSDSVKGKEGIISSLSNLAKAGTGMVGLVKKYKDGKDN